MRFSLSCLFPVLEILFFSKTWSVAAPLAKRVGFLGWVSFLLFELLFFKEVNYCLFALLLAVCWNVFSPA